MPWEPNPKQVAFVNEWLAGEKPGVIKRAAEAAGVDRNTTYHWFSKPEFRAYVERRRTELARRWSAKIDKALAEKAIKGDIGAIKLFYERFDGLAQRFEHLGLNAKPSEQDTLAKVEEYREVFEMILAGRQADEPTAEK